MLKVMIVDDEPIFRKFLKNCIDWNHHGFEIIAEAKNGAEALEIAQKTLPDIVLADINMPFMNGLDLTQKLKEKCPSTSVILITGYGEFEYAKKAVKLGVVDYILKPIEEDELTATLLRIANEKKKLMEEKDILESNKALIKESFLNILISNEYCYTLEKTKQQLNYFNITTQSLNFMVSSVEIDDLYQLWDDSNEIRLWKFAISNLLSDLITTQGNHIIFNGPEGRIISLIEFTNEEEAAAFNADGYNRLCRLVKYYFKFTVTVGIGSIYHGFENIRKSYIESLVTLHNKFIVGNNRVLKYEKAEPRYNRIGFYSSEVNESLLLNLRVNNWDKIQEKLESVFQYIKLSNLSIDYCIIICTGLISVCLSYITESGKNIEDVYGKNFSPYSEIKSKQTIHHLHCWILELYKRITDYSSDHKMTKTKKFTEDAISFIEKNYSNNGLSVEDISRSLYVNSSYLRAAFKKETGTTLVEHILDIRMKKAKELIDCGNIRLSEVSSMVGFNDPAYFSKCFKKYYGICPREYEISVK